MSAKLLGVCGEMSSENLQNKNRTNPTSASQEENPNEDIQHQDKASSKEKVKGRLLTTPYNVMDASLEKSGGTTNADLDAGEGFVSSSSSSQSCSITSCSSWSISKRNSATVKAVLAKLRLEQAEKRFKQEELRKEADLKEIKAIEEERKKNRPRQSEEFEEHRGLIQITSI